MGKLLGDTPYIFFTLNDFSIACENSVSQDSKLGDCQSSQFLISNNPLSWYVNVQFKFHAISICECMSYIALKHMTTTYVHKTRFTIWEFRYQDVVKSNWNVVFEGEVYLVYIYSLWWLEKLCHCTLTRMNMYIWVKMN